VAVKLFQDGGFGAATAALSTPYNNEPTSTGLLTWPQEQLNVWARAIQEKGLRISIHAIGDRAIASALDAIEYALSNSPPIDHRHRIEHCGLPLPPLAERLADLDVVPVLQPSFLWFDGGVYIDRVGKERADWLYPVKELLEQGLNVAGSSDGPVIPDISPLLGAYAAVVRSSHDGSKVGPRQAVDVETALSLFTNRAAYALGEEHLKGSIEPGKVADFVILPVDPMAVAIDELPQIPVEAVFVGGAEPWQSE
jgi:predicted amidohydrolase YtcJ